jgi:hypothetical protein
VTNFSTENANIDYTQDKPLPAIGPMTVTADQDGCNSISSSVEKE